MPTHDEIRYREYIDSLHETVGGLASEVEALTPSDTDVREELKGIVDYWSPIARGELPEDVTRSVVQSAGLQALTQGLGMDQAARYLTARDLGLTSLDLAATGTAQIIEAGGLMQQYEALDESSRQFDVSAGLKATDLMVQTMRGLQSDALDMITLNVQAGWRGEPTLQDTLDLILGSEETGKQPYVFSSGGEDTSLSDWLMDLMEGGMNA